MIHSLITEQLKPAGNQGTPLKSFYDPLSRRNVQIFNYEKVVCVKNKSVVMDDEFMYFRLAAVHGKKKVTECIMSFENSPVPLSLFSGDGTVYHYGKQSDFMHKLEEFVKAEISGDNESADCVIYDGHTVTRILPRPTDNGDKLTFKDLAKRFM